MTRREIDRRLKVGESPASISAREWRRLASVKNLPNWYAIGIGTCALCAVHLLGDYRDGTPEKLCRRCPLGVVNKAMSGRAACGVEPGTLWGDANDARKSGNLADFRAAATKLADVLEVLK